MDEHFIRLLVLLYVSEPQSQFECVSASHGVMNSLDNSFTEFSQLPNDADLFKRSISSYVTSPKELQLRILSVNKEVKRLVSS